MTGTLLKQSTNSIFVLKSSRVREVFRFGWYSLGDSKEYCCNCWCFGVRELIIGLESLWIFVAESKLVPGRIGNPLIFVAVPAHLEQMRADCVSFLPAGEPHHECLLCTVCMHDKNQLGPNGCTEAQHKTRKRNFWKTLRCFLTGEQPAWIRGRSCSRVVDWRRQVNNFYCLWFNRIEWSRTLRCSTAIRRRALLLQEHWSCPQNEFTKRFNAAAAPCCKCCMYCSRVLYCNRH